MTRKLYLSMYDDVELMLKVKIEYKVKYVVDWDRVLDLGAV